MQLSRRIHQGCRSGRQQPSVRRQRPNASHACRSRSARHASGTSCLDPRPCLRPRLHATRNHRGTAYRTRAGPTRTAAPRVVTRRLALLAHSATGAARHRGSATCVRRPLPAQGALWQRRASRATRRSPRRLAGSRSRARGSSGVDEDQGFWIAVSPLTSWRYGFTCVRVSSISSVGSCSRLLRRGCASYTAGPGNRCLDF